MVKHALPCSLLILNSSSLKGSELGRGTIANNVLGRLEVPFSFPTFCYCVAFGFKVTSIIDIPQTEGECCKQLLKKEKEKMASIWLVVGEFRCTKEILCLRSGKTRS